jgi:hypothetical protein
VPGEDFDPQAELAKVQQRRQMAQRKAYRRSKADRWRAELVELRRAGASYEDLRAWLRSKRLHIAKSSLMRCLKERWPESPDYQGGGGE